MKIRDYAILLLFVLTPFAFISFGLIHTGQNLFFVLCGLILVSFLNENKWVIGFFVYVGIWQLFLFIQTLNNPLVAIDAARGLSQLLFFISGAILFLAVSKSKLSLQWFYNIICVTALIQAMLAVTQINNCDPVLMILNSFVETQVKLSKTTIVGTLGNQNFLAAYLAIALPFFFRPYWKYCIPLLIVLICYSKTSTAVMAALIGMAFLGGGGYLRILIAIIFGFLYMFILDKPFFAYEITGATTTEKINNITSLYSSDRFGMWKGALKEIFKSWQTIIFGYGPGAKWGVCPLHNEYLQAWHQFGLTGLFLIIGFIISLSRYYINLKIMLTKKGNMLLASFIVICINMIGNYPLHLAPSAFLIIIVVGLMQRERIKQ